MTPLRQRMIEDMEIRNLSRNTQLSYLQQVSSFAKYCHRSPELLGPEEIRAYQVYLTTERKLAPGTLCIIASALRFLYKVTLKREWVDAEIPLPKKPFKLPVILSREEVAHFLDSIASFKHRTLLMTAYAAGLRISEVTRLKLTDIDSGRMMLRVEQGKGAKCSAKHFCPYVFAKLMLRRPRTEDMLPQMAAT
ncbi:MAG: phage integrase N-terminal SAM-like domain-containing protein [Betaproteobacteria bacterium]|nr:phage integrase N-terminal SAM-like domain-containing protein [Betaproteobacteria bacterium]